MSKNFIVNNKPLKIVATAAWDQAYRGIEAALYVKTAIEALQKKGVDMLVFENVTENGQMMMQVRCAGYDLETDSILDKKTILFSESSLEIQTFWFKLDLVSENMYVGTFLFPSDY